MTSQSYSQIGLFIRSSIFFIYMCIAIPVYSVFVISSVIFPLRIRFMIIRSFLRLTIFLLKHICHVRYKISGLSNVPTDRVGVVLSKHQSTWETFYLPLIFKDPAIIAKRELAWVPFFGWGMAVSSPIFIDRKSKSTAMQQIITKGRECFQNGRWIMVFPEGTRIPYGQVGQYKLGGARLAVATEAPVMAVAHNAGRYWPKRGFIKQPGTIHMVISPLIETKGRTAEELMKEVSEWIEGTIKTL